MHQCLFKGLELSRMSSGYHHLFQLLEWFVMISLLEIMRGIVVGLVQIVCLSYCYLLFIVSFQTAYVMLL